MMLVGLAHPVNDDPSHLHAVASAIARKKRLTESGTAMGVQTA